MVEGDDENVDDEGGRAGDAREGGGEFAGGEQGVHACKAVPTTNKKVGACMQKKSRTVQPIFG